MPPERDASGDRSPHPLPLAIPTSEPVLVHATCVALQGRGVLVFGRPGAGKSDLALRLLDLGASLVADDQVHLKRHDGEVLASAVPSLFGLLEVRGVGIFRVGAVRDCVIALVVDLDPHPEGERLPAAETRAVLGVAVPLIRLDPSLPSAASIVRLAVHADRVA